MTLMIHTEYFYLRSVSNRSFNTNFEFHPAISFLKTFNRFRKFCVFFIVNSFSENLQKEKNRKDKNNKNMFDKGK